MSHVDTDIAAKVMPMTTRLPAIQALGKFFGMSTEAGAPVRLLPAAEPVRLLPAAEL